MGRFKAQRESEIQIQTVAYAKTAYPILKTLGFAVNNNSFSIGQGVKNKRMGVTAGVYDFLILFRSGRHTALAIDFKLNKNKLSPAQRAFKEAAEKQGVRCEAVYSFQEGKRLIDEYMAGAKN